MSMKEWRLKAKMTQEEVAQKLNIQRTTVSMWETGESNPRADKLPQLAALYGCTIDELFEDREASRPA